MDSGLKQSGQCKQILLISFNHQLHSHVPLNKIKKLEGAWFPLRPWFDCYLTEHSWPKEWGHLAARFGTRLKSAILKCHIAGSGRIQQESKQSRLFGRKSQILHSSHATQDHRQKYSTSDQESICVWDWKKILQASSSNCWRSLTAIPMSLFLRMFLNDCTTQYKTTHRTQV